MECSQGLLIILCNSELKLGVRGVLWVCIPNERYKGVASVYERNGFDGVRGAECNYERLME
jgi:hypothetical protein